MLKLLNVQFEIRKFIIKSSNVFISFIISSHCSSILISRVLNTIQYNNPNLMISKKMKIRKLMYLLKC